MGGILSFMKSVQIPAGLDNLTFGEIKFEGPDKEELSISHFRGKCFVIVNTASSCGFAKKNFTMLNELYNRYGSKGLEIIAFPTRQTQQEFKDVKDSIDFARELGVSFPIMRAVDINGPKAHSIFNYLKFHAPGNAFVDGSMLKPIGWNFGKFVVDRSGHCYGYLGPNESAQKLETLINTCLAQSEDPETGSMEGMYNAPKGSKPSHIASLSRSTINSKLSGLSKPLKSGTKELSQELSQELSHEMTQDLNKSLQDDIPQSSSQNSLQDQPSSPKVQIISG